MATLQFDLVAPERVLFSGAVDAVLLPGIEGEMTILPGHVPLVTALKSGYVVANDHKGSGTRVFVRGGLAEVNGAGVTVLAERATPAQELTPEILEHEILEAGMRRDGSDDPAVRHEAEAAIAELEEARATLRL